MRFLADECCDFAVVRALRAAGHDVQVAAEQHSGAPDRDVLALALHEDRILLTEDKDFGQLVYASQAGTAGVILIRFPSGLRQSLGPSVTRLVDEHGDRLIGCFVILRPGTARISVRPIR